MSRQLIIEYPTLPPSDNHIRVVQYRFFGKKRKAIVGYSKDAENFLRYFRNWVSADDDLFLEIQRFTSGHKLGMVYRLEILLFFAPEQLLNKTWLERWSSDSKPGTKTPHKKGERKAKSPYKRLDSLNRRKLLEDCLAEALGIDDSLNWQGEVTKLVAVHEPKVVLILEETKAESFGIPEEYWHDGA